MEITEVRVNLQHEEVLKAFASITLDDEFVIRGLKVIQGTHGRFVAMPARKKRDGTFQDIAHPINKETRSYLERVVLEAYDLEVEENGSEDAHHQDGNQKPVGVSSNDSTSAE